MNGTTTEEWYTTTFSIPRWLRDKLKSEVKKKAYNGMSEVVVIACTNHLLKEDPVDKDKKDLVDILYKSEVITERDKKILLR